jgi:hypothetical protein
MRGKMSKIKSVITYGKVATDGLPLLRSVNEGLGDVLKSLVGGKKSPATDVKKDTTPERAMPGEATTNDHNSNLKRLSSEALQVVPSESRVIIAVSRVELSNLYLKSGGGQSLVTPDNLSDIEIADFKNAINSESKPSGSTKLIYLGKTFTFSSMIDAAKAISGATDVILLNIPNSLLAEFQKVAEDPDGKETSETKLPKTRAILAKMMLHKYYVMTLDLSKAKKIEAQMGTAESADEVMDAFDPHIVTNYPVKQVKVAALNEWDSMKSEEPQQKAPEQSAEPKVDTVDDAEGKMAQSALDDTKEKRAAEIADLKARYDKIKNSTEKAGTYKDLEKIIDGLLALQ